MQTGTRDYYGKNQYWTPPNMTTTESLIGNALRSIDITGEVSGDMFSINANNEIEPIGDLPIRTSEMKVTTVDDTDDDSVVNIEYLSNQVNALDNRFLTLTQATNTYETIANHNADKEALQTSINSKANAADVYTKTESDDRYAPKGSPAELLDTVECDFVDETAYWSTFDAAKVEIVRFNAIASDFDYELAFSAAFLASHYPELGTSPKVWIQVNGGSYMQYGVTGSILQDVTMHDARNEGQAGKLEYFRSKSHVSCSAGDEIVFSFSIETDRLDQGTYTLYLQPNSDDWPRYFRASFSIAGNDYYTKYEADERFEPKSSLQANYYDKTAVDGIRTAIVAAADSKYVQIANVGSLTLPSSINISYTTTETVDDVRVESTDFQYRPLPEGTGVIFNDTFKFKDKTTQVTFTVEFDANNQYLVPMAGIQAYIYDSAGSSSMYVIGGFTIDNNSITKTISISASSLSKNTNYKLAVEFGSSITPSTDLSNEHATLKVIQGTKQAEITHILSLENYIKYLINNN